MTFKEWYKLNIGTPIGLEEAFAAGQQAERERAKELVEALETIKRDAPIRASAYITANAAINEYNGEK